MPSSRSALRGPFADRGLHLVEEPGQVPVEGIEDPHRPIGEAVNFLHLQELAVEPAQQPAAALGPQVERQIVARRRHGASLSGRYSKVEPYHPTDSPLMIRDVRAGQQARRP